MRYKLRYTLIDKDICPLVMAELYGILQTDEIIEIIDELPTGQLSHIVLRGTTIPVGFIGDDSLELAHERGKEDSSEITHGKKHIFEIYEEAKNKVFIEKAKG